MKKIITILFILQSSIFNLQLSEAQVIHVPADQPSIQAGIDYATNGDTVLVANGTYLENINFLGKAITVASNFIIDGDTNHINNTIIDGSMPDDPDYGSVVTFLTGEDSTSVLSGFTITGGTGMADPATGARIGGGIVCYYSTARIIHNIITGNGIYDVDYAWGAGIACVRDNGADRMVIRNNIISNNQSISYSSLASGGGVEVWGNAVLSNNTISGNSATCTLGNVYGAGIFNASLDSPANSIYLENNTIQNNNGEGGSWASGGGFFNIWGICFISDNEITNNTLSAESTFGGGIDIDEATSAEINGNNINHNTLNGGNTYGAGIYLYLGSDYEITNNELSYNSVNTTFNTWYGAGLLCDQVGTTLIKGNEFSNNYGPVEPVGAGGGICILNTNENSITVSANFFFQNTAYHGGGIFTRRCFHSYFTNNIFSGNFASRGGGMGFYNPAGDGSLTMEDSQDSHPLVINNTFYNNEASNDGGAFRFQGDLNAPEILNCIFWDNSSPTGGDINNNSSLSLSVSYSDIETNSINGPWNGEGNIYSDPKFKAADPYCHLTESSPCREAGIINFNTPPVDFDREPRPDPVGGGIDLGADEFWGMPEAPVALDPDTIVQDYFIALWHPSIPLALGYEIDVAHDIEFNDFVIGYEDLDVGSDTSIMITGLEAPEYIYYYRVRAYNALWTSPNSNTIEVLITGVKDPNLQPSTFNIQCYPNPSRGIVDCQFRSASWRIDCRWVTIKIYDIHGREVAVVVDEKMPAGEHQLRVDLAGYPAGIYILKASADDQIVTQKILITN